MMAALTPGFAEPVGGAQSCFRLVLDAMARPGRVHAVGGVAAPAPLCDAAAAVVLTLMDHETPLWLDPDAEAARAWIAFHTGAPPIGDPARACFALALSPDTVDWSCLFTGTDEAPEGSATVILQVASLATGKPFVLDGPGLREPATLSVDGLPGDFAALWQRNHTLYPCGFDLILCSANQLAALPRSVAVREG
jgi:alpha-D-ribose 1-methylphosphonate 5-triphosphate synthase subunit PhnH